MRKKVYISGKIGKEVIPSEEVLQKFASAEKFLKAKGYKRDTGTEGQRHRDRCVFYLRFMFFSRYQILFCFYFHSQKYKLISLLQQNHGEYFYLRIEICFMNIFSPKAYGLPVRK